MYELFEDMDDAGGASSFLMLELWESAEALGAHAKSAHVQTVIEKMKAIGVTATVKKYASVGY